MTDLKTLKGLPCIKDDEYSCCGGDKSKHERKECGRNDEGPWTEDTDLKQEAINYIKELKRYDYMEKDGYCLSCNEWFEGFGKHGNCLVLDNFCESSDIEGAIKILKHIFNITESDLK